VLEEHDQKETKEYILINGVGQFKTEEEFLKLNELGIESDATITFNPQDNQIYHLIIHNDKARVSLDSQGGILAKGTFKFDDGLDEKAEKIFNAINENDLQDFKDTLQEFFENGDAISLNIQPSQDSLGDFKIACNIEDKNSKTNLATTALLNRKSKVKKALETRAKNWMNNHKIDKNNSKAKVCESHFCQSEVCKKG